MKLCGCKEKCFEQGDKWGDLKCALCKHLETRNIKFKGHVAIIGHCTKDCVDVDVYTPSTERDIKISLFKKFAMDHDWIEIMPNVYHDNCGRMIRLGGEIHPVYLVYENGKRLTFRSIDELEEFYDNTKMSPSDTEENTSVSDLKQLASREKWTEITPSVYRDEVGRNISEVKTDKGVHYMLFCNNHEILALDSFVDLVRFYDKMHEMPEHNYYFDLVEELKLHGIPYILNNDVVTSTFTPCGNIQLIFPDREGNRKVYEILDKYREYFYFRESLVDDGSINIWIYKTKKSYRDHVNHVLNNRKKE